MQIVLLIFALLTSPLAWADTLRGYVVGITDGDTLTVVDSDKHQFKIRLKGIDAPERNQAFGEKSKTNLSRLAFNKDVEVEWNTKDRYGRIVGKVMVAGQDVCLQQVKEGMAWWYAKYQSEQTQKDRAAYELAESQAKMYRYGLWNDKNPVPPWGGGMGRGSN